MPSRPRFVAAADNRRPYGSHRCDVWSPKLNRRLTLFGKRAFSVWLAIESDPSIRTFCERPLVQKGARSKRVIDYWVERQEHQEEFWTLLRPSELEKQESGATLFPGFDDLAQKLQILIRYIKPAEEFLSEQAAANWRFMLHYLAANRDLIPKSMLERLQATCSAGRSIQDLELEFAEHDPVVVRCGVFSLIQTGGLTAVDLVCTQIGPSTRVARP